MQMISSDLQELDEADSTTRCDSESSYDQAKKWKENGNELFNKNNLEGALNSYEKGVQCLEYKRDQSMQKNSPNEIEMELALRSNIGLVLFKLERYERSVKECSLALELDANSMKGKINFYAHFLMCR